MAIYPNNRNNAAGAIPVYVVAQPTHPPYPDDQKKITSAIPVNIVSVGTPNSGPIPIIEVSQPGVNTPYGTDQGVSTNAIPVYSSTAPNAMLVWLA